MPRVPPPLPSEQRQHPRIELLAHVEWKTAEQVHILRVRNASKSGLFLEGSPDELSSLQVGTQVELALFAGDAPLAEPIALSARIVRVDRGSPTRGAGFGLSVAHLGPEARERYHALLGRAGSGSIPPPLRTDE